MVIASVNVNNILLILMKLDSFFMRKDIHILALINDTKIDSDYVSEPLKIEGYRFDILDRKRREGGIDFYIRDFCGVDVREDIPVSSLKVRCIEMKPVQAKPLFVVSWYQNNLTKT